MAIQRYVIDGYGQVELNQVAFRRDGRVEAQCKLDDTDFATVPAENGMLLAVDKLKGVVKFATDASLPIALNYTTEHMYDERTSGLKNFKLERGTFLPRLGYLSVGDTFTTNCLCYDSTEFATDAKVDEALAAIATTAVYGGISAKGAIKLSATAPTVGPKLKVVKVYTMPDGQRGLKFHVISA